LRIVDTQSVSTLKHGTGSLAVWMLNKALEQGFAQQCFIGVTAGGENHLRVLKRALCAQLSVSEVDTSTLGQGER
jgi:hypothetical protein